MREYTQRAELSPQTETTHNESAQNEKRERERVKEIEGETRRDRKRSRDRTLTETLNETDTAKQKSAHQIFPKANVSIRVLNNIWP